MRRFLPVALVFLLTAFPFGLLRAQLADPFALLASSSYNDIRQGVIELGRSGNDRALPVIEALHQGNLYVRPDRKLFIRAGSGFVDAQTGAPAPDVSAGTLRKVRVSAKQSMTLWARCNCSHTIPPSAGPPPRPCFMHMIHMRCRPLAVH
jgi:urea transport system permease protein